MSNSVRWVRQHQQLNPYFLPSSKSVSIALLVPVARYVAVALTLCYAMTLSFSYVLSISYKNVAAVYTAIL